MKKTISFEKKIEFPSMIGEITSISLDHNLKFIDPSNITGNLILSGTYKLTEASRIEDDFYYELPTEIILTEELDLETSKIEIDDFFYEIENDYNVICYVDVRIEGVEVVDCSTEEKLPSLNEIEQSPQRIELDEERECDGELTNEITEKKEEDYTMNAESENVVETLFENINESEAIIYRPVPSPIDKIKNRYRWRIILKGKLTGKLIDIINFAISNVNLKTTRIIVDTNPTNLN